MSPLRRVCPPNVTWPGVSRDSQDFVPLKDLGAQIDGMPMRRAEIRDNGKH